MERLTAVATALAVFTSASTVEGLLPSPNSQSFAQERTVVLRVLTADGDTPLANAEVVDLGSGTRTLTSTTGITRFGMPAVGTLKLRVRQIGFTFSDMELRRQDLASSPADTIVVRLRRIVFALPVVRTTAARDCPSLDSDVSSLASWALDQLRESAERYEHFRTAYPFTVTVERRTVVRDRRNPEPAVTRRSESTSSERWGEKYKIGEVVASTSLGFSVPILFLATLADPAFWEHHCVAGAALEGSIDNRLVRLRFVPSPHVRATDWEGDALMDSSTSELRRVGFKLRIAGNQGPRRFEGYTTFRIPSPFVVVPDSTVALWWRTEPSAGQEWGLPHVVQLVRVEKITFRKEEPPPR